MNILSLIKKPFLKLFSSLSQTVEGGGMDENATITEGMPELLRLLAAEGAVLLKNDNNTLPLYKENSVAVFGRVQKDYFYVGYGSGGSVRTPYKVSLLDALRNHGAALNEHLAATYDQWCKANPVDHGYWGHWPFYYPEMPIEDAQIEEYAKQSDTALVVIGRAAGEDRDNKLEKGSYYLTDAEESLIARVAKRFKKSAVILNIGNMIDMSWIEKYQPDAVLLAWQGGMESGNGLYDVLYGVTPPSGKLTGTVAKTYEDYPAQEFGNRDFNFYKEDIYLGYRYFSTFCSDKVLYPFGFGLGYTSFEIRLVRASQNDLTVSAEVRITNTGATSGKEVVQLYLSKPQGSLGQPRRELAAFCKTALLAPGDSADVIVTAELSSLASYDDSGKSGHKHCYVLEAGEYKLYLGTDAASAQEVFCFLLEESFVQPVKQVCPVQHTFERIVPEMSSDGFKEGHEKVKTGISELLEEIALHLPDGVLQTGDKGIKLQDVAKGNASMDDFVAQLNNKELEAISRGDYVMGSKLGAKGNAGVFGGVLESLRHKGVPPVTTTDGPSGIRLNAGCSLLPIGTLTACSWNPTLIKQVYYKVAEEMRDRGSDVLLAPGMNLHRNPLCGRNFEYFSEDPLLSGEIAAAVVEGLQSGGVAACPKHFACNNQETNRNHNDTRISERALRELYLRGFEICVKKSKPLTVMTSYNLVNGVWSHYNYHLCTTSLREEWGFEGCVMTDWWMRPSFSPEFPTIRDNAYRVRAQVDVLMPGGKRVGLKRPDGTLLETLGKPGGITLGELQRTAKNVLGFIIKLKQ